MVKYKRITAILTKEQYATIKRLSLSYTLGVTTVIRLLLSEKLEEIKNKNTVSFFYHTDFSPLENTQECEQ
ncbi:MAG: hypothetical protein DIAAKJNI_00531 [Candidatus Argoarchaeum ethanivorans]|uniref:Uncharacterized protein n=1 Tax=Candidatus Argoarchaeum ethanivorans TaxID=2608793 RepID=A0A811TGK8_9EURY|nr:MAG: hypothetical protein DIAAKJNI_00531 [Candidatus Argoarchaeum ethanivorans]